MPPEKAHPYKIGKSYQVRTVTMIISGILTAVFDDELILESAAWIADTGRFTNALRDPNQYAVVEPFPNPVIVGRGAIVDVTEIAEVIYVQKG